MVFRLNELKSWVSISADIRLSSFSSTVLPLKATASPAIETGTVAKAIAILTRSRAKKFCSNVDPSRFAAHCSSGSPTNSNVVNAEAQKKDWPLQSVDLKPFPVLALKRYVCSSPMSGSVMQTLRIRFIVAGIINLDHKFLSGLMRNFQNR